jgi:hypothetical protein
MTLAILLWPAMQTETNLHMWLQASWSVSWKIWFHIHCILCNKGWSGFFKKLFAVSFQLQVILDINNSIFSLILLQPTLLAESPTYHCHSSYSLQTCFIPKSSPLIYSQLTWQPACCCAILIVSFTSVAVIISHYGIDIGVGAWQQHNVDGSWLLGSSGGDIEVTYGHNGCSNWSFL